MLDGVVVQRERCEGRQARKRVLVQLTEGLGELEVADFITGLRQVRSTDVELASVGAGVVVSA